MKVAEIIRELKKAQTNGVERVAMVGDSHRWEIESVCPTMGDPTIQIITWATSKVVDGHVTDMVFGQFPNRRPASHMPIGPLIKLLNKAKRRDDVDSAKDVELAVGAGPDKLIDRIEVAADGILEIIAR